jgi:hypothetical protein
VTSCTPTLIEMKCQRGSHCKVLITKNSKKNLEKKPNFRHVRPYGNCEAKTSKKKSPASVICGYMAILELDLGTELAGFSLNDKKKTNAKDRENALVGELAKACDVVVS